MSKIYKYVSSYTKTLTEARNCNYVSRKIATFS